MCAKHYQRNRLTGTTDAPPPRQWRRYRPRKLTWEKVRKMRKDTRKQTHIAEFYGVSQATVSLVLNRKTWTSDPKKS